MKKTVKLFAIVILGASIFVACKKKKEEEPVATASDVPATRAYIFDTVPWTGSSIVVALGSVSNQQLETDAFLAYTKIGTSELQYPAPGPGPNGDYVYRCFYNPNDTNAVTFTLRSHDWDGTAYTGADSIHQLRIVHIESIKTSTLGMTKKPNEIVFDQLEDAGISINSYEDVVRFYGVEE